MKPVLKYLGSKWRIADQIVQMIPEHRTYCEPYFGSGAVFFRKPPSDIELINDLDNDVPNLFKCIRDSPERLAAVVAAIPYSRYEYERAFYATDETDLTGDEIALIMDCGSLCFGYTRESENFFYIFED